MKDTGFGVPEAKRDRLAKVYEKGPDGELQPVKWLLEQGARPALPKLLSGGGGLFSTTGDYARFMQMLLNGGQLDGVRILSPKTVELMMANHLSLASRATLPRRPVRRVSASGARFASTSRRATASARWGSSAGRAWRRPTPTSTRRRRRWPCCSCSTSPTTSTRSSGASRRSSTSRSPTEGYDHARRTLGRTGVSVSEIGFGAWAIGGSWGEQKEDDSIAALHRALDLGCNFVDTAAGYGNGRSERIIGKVLKERKETVFVATKTPPAPGPWPPTPYCRDDERYSESHPPRERRGAPPQPRHRPDRPAAAPHLDARLEPQPAALRDLRKLQAEGKIRFIGLDPGARPEQRHRPDAAAGSTPSR